MTLVEPRTRPHGFDLNALNLFRPTAHHQVLALKQRIETELQLGEVHEQKLMCALFSFPLFCAPSAVPSAVFSLSSHRMFFLLFPCPPLSYRLDPIAARPEKS